MRYEGKRDAETLLHAERKASCTLRPGVGEPHRLQHLFDTCVVDAEHRGAHAQVFTRGQVGVERDAR